MKGQNHSNSFGQHSGNSNSKQNSKCDLLEIAGRSVGIANEEQEAEKAESGGEEQGATETSVTGLDHRSVLVFHKEFENNSCENSEVQGCASQRLLQGVFINQKSYRFLEGVVLLNVGILMIWTLHTLFRI